MYTIYINNTLPPELAVHEIYRDIFGPPMVLHMLLKYSVTTLLFKTVVKHNENSKNVT